MTDLRLKYNRVLVVDDEEYNRDMLSNRLRRRGYYCLVAEGGEQALEIIAREEIDVVLLDIMMPVVDGYEVLRRLRSEPATEELPVIMVTANIESDEVVRSLEMGANDYITKPFELPILQARMDSQLLRKQSMDQITEFNEQLEGVVGERTELIRRLMNMQQGILDSVHQGIFALNHQQAILFSNHSLRKIARLYDESFSLAGFRDCFLQPAQLDEVLAAVMYHGETIREAKLRVRLRGDERLWLVRAAPLAYDDDTTRDGGVRGAVGIVEDVTEIHSLEAQLIHAGKLAALGEMATAVTHEIRQPLNVIRMSATMVVEAAPECGARAEFLGARADRIIGMVDRADRIIDRMRSFGRKLEPAHVDLDPHAPIQLAMDMVQERARRSGVLLHAEFSEHGAIIHGDAGALEQVYVNLFMNAIQALQEGREQNGVRPAIHVQTGEEDERFVVRVRDNGPGIPEELRTRIFEAFFTTKPVNEGTGLGLSISQGIMQSHNGSIRVECDGGTCFVLEFPLSPQVQNGEVEA